jgi:hypothetical protein
LRAGADEDHPTTGGPSRKVTGGSLSILGSDSEVLRARTQRFCAETFGMDRAVQILVNESAHTRYPPAR